MHKLKLKQIKLIYSYTGISDTLNKLHILLLLYFLDVVDVMTLTEANFRLATFKLNRLGFLNVHRSTVPYFGDN